MPRSFFELPFLSRKSGVVPCCQRALQDSREIAAVVGRPDRRLVGHRLPRNQIATPDLGAIDAELARGFVGKALQHITGLRTSRAAVGIGRHRIRIGAGDLHIDGGRAVYPGEQRAIDRPWNRRAEGRDVGADVGPRVDAQREEMPVTIQRERGARAMVPALRVGEKGLAPPGHPAHRPAQAPRRPRDDGFLRVVLALVAEAAAHVRRHDAKLDLADAELGAERLAQVVRRLRRAVQRQPGRARNGGHAAVLDRRPAQAVVDQLDLAPGARAGECLLHRRGVAAGPEETLFLDERKRLVFHLHLFGCVFRSSARFGEHRRHRLADMAHRVARERPARDLHHPRQFPAGSHRADIVCRHVPASKNHHIRA